MKKAFSKRLIGTCVTLGVVIFVQFGVLFAPQSAHAQFGGVVTDPGNYAQRAALFAQTQANETKDDVESSLSRSLTAGVLGILVNGVSFLARKLAYDTASYLASSAAGEESLVFKNGVGEYFSEAGLDTVGELVGSFGDTIGINLCTIPNPRINAFLQVGFETALAPTSAPKPRCTGQQLRNSWGRINEVLYERYGPGTEGFVAETFNASLSVGQSDFGIALEGLGRIKALQEVNEEAAKIERQIGQGFKDAKASISETIYTPSANIREEAKSLTGKDQSAAAQAQVAGLYAAADLYEVIPAAAGVFINTFASQLLEKSLKGLFRDDDQAGAGAGVGEFFASNLQSNRRKAQEALSFLLAPSIEQINSYNLVGEFAACPETPGLNNCVIDSTLLQAITVSKQGEPVTIREALDQGYLHENWPLISPRRTIDNSSANYDCYLNKYCYSNIQKLRRARILSLGFELAALNSDVDEPWTLGEVVAGFEDCNQFGESDSAHPFCHLIDPNWVIKAPETSCDTRVFGPQLIGRDTNLRRKECVDIKTCVFRDADGTCQDWGYCTREQKVWKLGGSACAAQYATCRTYTDTTSRSQVSYLSRTLDFGQCSEDSVGCRAFSTEQVGGSWIDPSQLTPAQLLAQKQAGRSGLVHFNNTLRSCSESAEGCHGFYLSARDQATGDFLRDPNTAQFVKDETSVSYLKKAPDYLGCYDINPGTLALELAQTRTEAATLNARTQCGNFALACAPSEVGCELFTSRDGEVLPAIVDPTQVCAPECAGYETFKEEAGTFNGETFPLYFVPGMASECSERYVGCEEFTNLEDSAGGGEQLEYYSDLKYCEKPDGTNEREYFSWEGSDSDGYVLRVHRMLQVSQTYSGQIQTLNLPANVLSMFPVGSPVYADDTFDTLITNTTVCNQQSYNIRLQQGEFAQGAANPDCRALYDDQGNVHYRLISQTVTVSEQCARLRKSTPELFVDQALTQAGQAACQTTLPNGTERGLWQSLTQGGTPVCQRCYNGGGYQNGSCIYQTIPEEASSCRAPSGPADAFVGCRAYTGNAGNNIDTRVIVESFEPADSSPQALSQVLTNWSVTNPRTQPGIRVAAEAVQVGQQSLEVDAQTVSRNISVDANTGRSLQANAWYELSFWSRGTPQNVSIAMYQGGNIMATFTVDRATFTPVSVTIGDGWQEYRLGPVQFVGSSTLPVEIRFTRAQIAGTTLGPYYIDQLRLGRLEDRLFLIKDSWQRTIGGQIQNAPASCFATNQDPGGTLPGVALGCREYQDSQNNTYFLTQFGSLCREEAVGCQPVFDSYNTISTPVAQVYNAWCPATQAVNGTCTITVNAQDLGSCAVVQGDVGCYIDAKLPTSVTVASLPAAYVVTSTIIIPAETNTPLFLTNRPEYNCRADQLGCMRVGLQTQAVSGNNANTFTYEDKFVRNDPDLYDEQLCEHGQVGCSEFLDGAATVYFKDPAVTGGSVCEYKTQVRVQGAASTQDGWFKQDVGVCSNSPATECRSDSQCGAGATCQKDISVPCYPTYLDATGEYGVWSNQAANYNGYVGSCPAEANACVELRDKFSTSTDQFGKAYYRILDNELTENAGDCDGQVSLTEGCVLFDLTSRPNKLYDTSASYNASNNATPQYRLVDPISSNRNDANLILKVDRDRACAEWLYCANSIPQTDDAGNKIQLCSRYQACQESDGNSCLQPVPTDPNGSYLDEQRYTGRDTSWFGLDYSGYSLLNRYQIPSYVYVRVDGAPASQYLAYEQDRTLFADPQFAALGCAPPANNPGLNTDGQACGAQAQGRCLQRRCLYPVDGTEFPALTLGQVAPVSDILAAITAPSCKGFPEETSPFPQTVLTGNLPVLPASRAGFTEQRSIFSGVNANEGTGYKPGFQDVNVCQTGNASDCSCSYKKVSYSAATTDYWPVGTDSQNIPEGVCAGGEFEGYACTSDDECTVNAGTVDAIPGFCQRRQRQETHIGLDGFCLEYDYSRPINGAADRARGDIQEYACLTWLPIQTSASGNDLYNRYLEAGYYPVDRYDSPGEGVTGQLMCASTERGSVIDATYLDSVASTANFVQRLSNELSDAALDQILHSDMLHFDCRENSDCGGGCVFAGFFTGVWAAVSNAIAGFFAGGPIGFVAGLGSGTAITIINASNNVQGSAYTLAMCSQYEQSLSSIPPDQNYPVNTPVSSYQTQSGFHQGLRSQIYQIFQAYALNRLGSNAVVLRAETDLVGMVNSSLTTSAGFAPWRLQSTANSDQHQVNPGRDRGNDAFDDEYARFTHGLSMDDTVEPGTYSFAGAANVVNEYNLEDVYFFPTAYKGTLRGVLPITINDIPNPNNSMTQFDDVALRLDVGGLRRGEDVPGGMPNGYFEPKAGIVIPPHNTYNQNGNSANIPGQWRVINFSARYNSNSRNENADEFQAVVPIENKHLLTWNYVVERPSNPQDTNASFFYNDNTIEQNTFRKYVHVFFTAPVTRDYRNRRDGWTMQSQRPSFMSNRDFFRLSQVESPFEMPSAPPQSPGEDPFSTTCQVGFVGSADANSPRHNAWFAVALNFDVNGNFLGYTTRWCDGLDSSISDDTERGRYSGGMDFAVMATMSNQCTDYRQVYDDSVNPITNSTNKAWTNRTWVGASDPLGRGTSLSARQHPTAQYSSTVDWNTGQGVYGSVPLPGRALTASDAQEQLKAFSFFDPNVDGIPYYCLQQLTPAQMTSFNPPGRSQCAFMWVNYSAEPAATASFYQSNNVPLRQTLESISVPGTANTAINQLFAQQFTQATLQPTRNTYDIAPTPNADISGTVTSGRPDEPLVGPRIYSLDPSRCFSGVSAVCTIGEPDNLTVNQRNGTFKDYNGDGFVDEDNNGDAIPDPVVGLGTVIANINFYAIADDNRMPIKQVMIDFGNDRNSPNGYGRYDINLGGLYKNRKPFCEDTDQPAEVGVGLCLDGNDQPTNITCEQDRDCPVELRASLANGGQSCATPEELKAAPFNATLHSAPKFGNTQRACEERYFEYTGVYACSLQDVNSATPPGYVYDVANLQFNGRDYSSRVQEILGPNSTVQRVCAFVPRVRIIDNWGYCNGRISPLNAGYRSYYGQACDPNTNPANQDAWTYYQGAIIVIPN